METRVDLHCHTAASFDGKVDPARFLELARDRGLTHVAITDHETLDGALAAHAANISGIELIVGQEVRTAEGDLILLFVREVVPGGLSLDETVRRAREQGALIGLPHPFDAYRPSIARGAARTADLARLAAVADYVEVHNGRVSDVRANSRAAEFASHYGLAGTAASDAHTEAEIGTAYAVLSVPFAGREDFVESLSTAALGVREAPTLERGLFDRLGSALRLKGPQAR
jgi:predicted metal-dependent phosphoesterase TrpH